MKYLLATTALVAMTAISSVAQTDPVTPTGADLAEPVEAGTSSPGTDDLIDRSLYAKDSDAPNDGSGTAAADWENIGTIDDLILTSDGAIVGVVLDIGRYFGLGAKSVSVPIDQIALVTEPDSTDAVLVVYAGPAATLQNLPELDRTEVNNQGLAFYSAGNTAVGSDQGLTEDTVTQTPAAPQTDSATGSDLGQNDAASAQLPYLTGDALAALTANDLQGAAVFDMSGAHVGNISDILLTDAGAVDRIIVDVGGFLGLGAKSVAIDFADLQFTHESGATAGSLRAMTVITADQFSTMAEWEG